MSSLKESTGNSCFKIQVFSDLVKIVAINEQISCYGEFSKELLKFCVGVHIQLESIDKRVYGFGVAWGLSKSTFGSNRFKFKFIVKFNSIIMICFFGVGG